MNEHDITLGSICAGIGGFDSGFEAAGWNTKWQIELDDVNRAVLAFRFPAARQFRDLRDWKGFHLSPVACICAGFPCQDISVMGNPQRNGPRQGLGGARSGLFFTIMEIIRCLRPQWVVLKNVPALLSSNDSRDIESIIVALAQCGYMGHGRVLDAQYFGVPQKRRRFFLVAGLGRKPHLDFLADAAPVESLPRTFGSERIVCPSDAWAGWTLTAPDKYEGQNSRFNMGSELFVIEEDGWHPMFEWGRKVELYGLRCGLDAPDAEEAYAAGNAVVPAIAQWIAEILKRS